MNGQDVAINKRMAEFGATVVPDNANILHHCNTGALATVDIGTAIGVIYGMCSAFIVHASPAAQPSLWQCRVSGTFLRVSACMPTSPTVVSMCVSGLGWVGLVRTCVVNPIPRVSRSGQECACVGG